MYRLRSLRTSTDLKSCFLRTQAMFIASLQTPSLVLDLDSAALNRRKLKEIAAEFGKQIRPHSKAHKCAEIAQLQVEDGAVGVCCATLQECEIMLRNDIPDVLLANEVAGQAQSEYLVSLAKLAREKNAKFSVCVDNIEEVQRLAGLLGDCPLTLLVEIDVGQHRCGVMPGAAVVPLVQEILRHPCFTFGGLQAYHGWVQHVRTPSQRRAIASQVAQYVRETHTGLREAGLPVPELVTGVGTGSLVDELKENVHTELQPGSYLFMDCDYLRNQQEDGSYVRRFVPSLFVLTTVISVANREAENPWVVVDAGTKACSMDSGAPAVLQKNGLCGLELSEAAIKAIHTPDLVYKNGGDEHGLVSAASEEAKAILRSINAGDRLLLVPGHCDPTVNLFNEMHGLVGDQVRREFAVEARSYSQATQ